MFWLIGQELSHGDGATNNGFSFFERMRKDLELYFTFLVEMRVTLSFTIFVFFAFHVYLGSLLTI